MFSFAYIACLMLILPQDPALVFSEIMYVHLSLPMEPR